MNLGIVTPVVTRIPGAHAHWEEGAGIADVARVTRTAEDLGYDFVTCSEHVAVPVAAATERGATYWDPLPTFGYLAAVTTRIRLATFVLVLAYHHPLAIAKRYGTLDLISNGRLILGVGVGSLEAEFTMLDAEWAARGAQSDDSLRALRAALSQREPAYRGRYYEFGSMVVDPCAVQEHVPIWVGGRSGRSLRRAVALADGWAPFGLRSAELAGLLDRARESDAWAERANPLEVIVQNDRPFDPTGEPDRVAEQLTKYRDLGATSLAARLVHHSLEHYCDQLAALAELA
ncbi:MAG: LLM class F420-dependent oxidoreductase [Acidimicrobiia bacterium]